MRVLGPLRHSAARPGFATAFERFVGELQGAGVEPARLGGGSGTLEGSAYLRDLSAIYDGYIATRDRLGRSDEHLVASRAIEVAASGGPAWGERPVFLYGLDDLTRNQLELIRALAGITEVTAAVTYEADSVALEARSALLERLRAVGVAEETATEPDPGNTESPLLFHLERGFGSREPARIAPGPGLELLRSSGERGEAEAVAAHIARLLTAGTDPAEIAIALRDPARRGPLFASVLEASGIPIALEAEIPAAATAVGGAMLALLDAELGRRTGERPAALPPGASGIRPSSVDWLERRVRRDRIPSAAEAIELLGAKWDEPPRDIARLRAATAAGGAALAAELAEVATRMASRPLRGDADGPMPGRGEGIELRAAAEISTALEELAALGRGAPAPRSSRARSAELRFLRLERAGRGPGAGSPAPTGCGPRVSTTSSSPRSRTASFRAATAAANRSSPTGSAPRWASSHAATPSQEERYLFHACLAVPSAGLCLSYRDSDENGGAEPRSPLIDEVRRPARPAAVRRGLRPGGGRDHPQPRPRDGRPAPRRSPLRRRPCADDRRRRGRLGGLADRRRGGRRRRRFDCPPAACGARGRGRKPRPGAAGQPRRNRVAGRRRRPRRHDARGVRRMLLPLVRLARAGAAAARSPARPGRPGRAHARGPRPALPRAAGRRAAASPASIEAWIERGRELVAEAAAARASAGSRRACDRQRGSKRC